MNTMRNIFLIREMCCVTGTTKKIFSAFYGLRMKKDFRSLFARERYLKPKLPST